jgi:16S rRNA (uracil1498-N3)-methyltransferase
VCWRARRRRRSRRGHVLPGRGAEPGLALLVSGLRPERLSWLVEKATELSVDRVTIVQTARTQSFRASPEALGRLERVARAAAKQSDAARWPRIAGPVPLPAALAEDPASHRIFLDAAGEGFPRELSVRSVALLVGPEGGWTDAERAAARVAGWSAAALPAGKLRAETAAIAALVLARAAWDVNVNGKRKSKGSSVPVPVSRLPTPVCV